MVAYQLLPYDFLHHVCPEQDGDHELSPVLSEDAAPVRALLPICRVAFSGYHFNQVPCIELIFLVEFFWDESLPDYICDGDRL